MRLESMKSGRIPVDREVGWRELGKSSPRAYGESYSCGGPARVGKYRIVGIEADERAGDLLVDAIVGLGEEEDLAACCLELEG